MYGLDQLGLDDSHNEWRERAFEVKSNIFMI